MANNIKPCPFCGSTNISCTQLRDGTYVISHHCDLNLSDLTTVANAYGNSKEEAIERWNRRANESKE
jgi:Lar family restriction alleviation protein